MESEQIEPTDDDWKAAGYRAWDTPDDDRDGRMIEICDSEGVPIGITFALRSAAEAVARERIAAEQGAVPREMPPDVRDLLERVRTDRSGLDLTEWLIAAVQDAYRQPAPAARETRDLTDDAIDEVVAELKAQSLDVWIERENLPYDYDAFIAENRKRERAIVRAKLLGSEGGAS